MRKYLIAGLVVLLPTVLTFMIVRFLFDLFTGPFVPIVRSILHFFSLPLPEGFILFLSRLIALLFLCILIFVLGFLARNFFFKNAIHGAHRLLGRIPFVKSVYKVSRDIFGAILSPDGKQAFKASVMVPFPKKPYHTLGFSSGEAPAECVEKAGEPLVAVFAPTAPHPISGFLFLIPERDTKILDMTKEDLIKYLVSCGVILPESEKQ